MSALELELALGAGKTGPVTGVGAGLSGDCSALMG